MTRFPLVFQRFQATNEAAGTEVRTLDPGLSNPAVKEPKMPNHTATAVAGDSSSLARNVGAFPYEINPLADRLCAEMDRRMAGRVA